MPEKKRQPVAKIFIGYRTRPVEGVQVPEFHPPSAWKDPEKIAANLAEQKANFLAECKNRPYTGTFDAVVIGAPGPEKLPTISYRPPGDPRGPVSQAVRNFLVANYEHDWGDDLYSRPAPKTVIIGFDPKTFLDILGTECSMPAIGLPLPPALWYDGSMYWEDVAAGLKAKGNKYVDLLAAVAAHRPIREESAKKWDAFAKDWKGPGLDPQADASIACEIAAQLGWLA